MMVWYPTHGVGAGAGSRPHDAGPISRIAASLERLQAWPRYRLISPTDSLADPAGRTEQRGKRAISPRDSEIHTKEPL